MINSEFRRAKFVERLCDHAIERVSNVLWELENEMGQVAYLANPTGSLDDPMRQAEEEIRDLIDETLARAIRQARVKVRQRAESLGNKTAKLVKAAWDKEQKNKEKVK